jgi:hypothetical protein
MLHRPDEMAETRKYTLAAEILANSALRKRSIVG